MKRPQKLLLSYQKKLAENIREMPMKVKIYGVFQTKGARFWSIPSNLGVESTLNHVISYEFDILFIIIVKLEILIPTLTILELRSFLYTIIFNFKLI